MHKLLRLLTSTGGWIFTIMCSGIIIGSIAALLIFNAYTKDLPDYSALEEYNPPTISRIYAKDGRLISEIAREKRIYAPLSIVPKRVIDAFLAAEDKNFYSHTGIDYHGIARAVITNVLSIGGNRSLVGGSTITQQVVKNFLLTNEKSLKRKIREAVLAIRITNVFTKDQILELYLNEIYLGNRSYGIAAAAMNYFNRSLDELSLEEAALLASLPKAPSKLDPNKNYDKALARRNWVLERMESDGRISEDEMEAAQAKPITLRKRTKQEKVDAAYFASEVKRFLIKQFGKKIVNEGGLSVITTLDPHLQALADRALRNQLISYDRRRGFRDSVGRLDSPADFQNALKKQAARKLLIRDQQLAAVLELDSSQAKIGLSDGSTGIIPMKLLKWTRRVLGDGILGPAITKPSDILSVGDVIIVGPTTDEQKKKLAKDEIATAWDLQQVPLVNGAMVVTDPHSGKVLAMSGGYHHQASNFNRATQAKRQPGSAFKPFIYLSAFENGMTPSTLVMDGPLEIANGADGEVWRPENYGANYLGPTTLRRGLEKSRNTMTVRLGQALGLRRIMEVAQRFDIYDSGVTPNLSMVLGTLETTALRLVNAYAPITNGGRKVQPILVERVEDRHGNIIYQRDLRGCPTCQIDNGNFKLTDLKPPALFDQRERIIDARIAYQVTSLLEGVVKRGTAASAASLPWAIGGKTGTTNESRDTWFMGISPDLIAAVFVGHDTPTPLGAKATGSSMALPIFKEFISAALEGSDKKPFTIPSGLERSKVDLATGYRIEPWEDDGRRTFWETFLRPEIPIFKVDTLLAEGDINDSHVSDLGIVRYEDDFFGPAPNQIHKELPWNRSGGSLGTVPDRFRNAPDPRSYREYRRPNPPTTYIPPSQPGVYIPQIGAPSRAPRRRDLPPPSFEQQTPETAIY